MIIKRMKIIIFILLIYYLINFLSVYISKRFIIILEEITMYLLRKGEMCEIVDAEQKYIIVDDNKSRYIKIKKIYI